MNRAKGAPMFRPRKTNLEIQPELPTRGLITARFDGRCAVCRKKWGAGEEIAWASGLPATCLGCAAYIGDAKDDA